MGFVAEPGRETANEAGSSGGLFSRLRDWRWSGLRGLRGREWRRWYRPRLRFRELLEFLGEDGLTCRTVDLDRAVVERPVLGEPGESDFLREDDAGVDVGLVRVR